MCYNHHDVKTDNAKNTTVTLDLNGLIGLAPFLDRETGNRLAGKLSTEDIDPCLLSELTPFADSGILDTLTKNVENVDLNELTGLAPFLDRETGWRENSLQKI